MASLDGLRALAVASVILYHARIALRGGAVVPGAIEYAGLVFALSVAAAALSWHLFERRFLALEDRWAPTRTEGAVPSVRAA